MPFCYSAPDLKSNSTCMIVMHVCLVWPEIGKVLFLLQTSNQFAKVKLPQWRIAYTWHASEDLTLDTWLEVIRRN